MSGSSNNTDEGTLRNPTDLKERDFATPHPDPKIVSPGDIEKTTAKNQEQEEYELDSETDSTATGSDDEFDWDEDGEEGQQNAETKTARRGRAVWVLFMRLARPLRVFIIGILGCGILVTPFIVTELRFKDNDVTPQVHVWSLWLTVIWAAACGTSLVVQFIPKLLIRLIVLFGGHVELFQIQLELVLAVSSWLTLALDIAWAWIGLSVIRAVYEPDQFYWVIINRVLQALFAAGIILLAEKILLRYIAINFHRKALSDRLTENRIGLKALDRLSNAEPVPVKRRVYNPKRGHLSASYSTGDISTLDRSRINTGTNTPNNEKAEVSPSVEKAERHHHHRPHLGRKHRHKDSEKGRKKAISTIIVDTLNEVAFKDSDFHKQMDLGSLSSARKLARKLFQALARDHPDRTALIESDFVPYFKSTEEAHAAFLIFDKDDNGDISKREMRDAVQRIYRERKALAASLKDVGSAVAKLDGVLVFICLIIIFFICLLIFNPNNTIASLVPLATLILGFSFVFGSSAQKLFESLIFIFSTHVFDVGDLVMIDDNPLFVKEFGLFSTTFRRVDGQEIVAPNSLLAGTKLVHNIRRSNSMWETTSLMVSYDTPLQALDELRARYRQFIADNSREWAGCDFNIDHMTNQNVIFITIAMQHRANWQDWGARWARRTDLMRQLKNIMEDLEIKYTMPVQPVVLPKTAPWNNAGGNPLSPTSPRGPSASPRSAPQPFAPTLDLGNAGTFPSRRQQL